MMEQRTISRTQLKRQNTTETVIVLAFFLFLLALGLLLYQDYGLTWDDLVYDLVASNSHLPTYLTDFKDEWREWFGLSAVGEGPIYRVELLGSPGY